MCNRSELFSSSGLTGNLFLFPEFALLNAHEDILVAAARYYIISDDHLSVLLRPHPEVDEIGVTLVQLLQGALGLHDQVCHQGCVLDGGDLILWVVLNRDAYIKIVFMLQLLTIEVDNYVADCTRLFHQLIQVLLHFTLVLVRLQNTHDSNDTKSSSKRRS